MQLFAVIKPNSIMNIAFKYILWGRPRIVGGGSWKERNFPLSTRLNPASVILFCIRLCVLI